MVHRREPRGTWVRQLSPISVTRVEIRDGDSIEFNRAFGAPDNDIDTLPRANTMDAGNEPRGSLRFWEPPYLGWTWTGTRGALSNRYDLRRSFFPGVPCVVVGRNLFGSSGVSRIRARGPQVQSPQCDAFVALRELRLRPPCQHGPLPRMRNGNQSRQRMSSFHPRAVI
jgi:hypothetical protein